MPSKAPHPAWIEIDLHQFRNNLMKVRSYIGKSLLCLPIKANAYGHGLCQIAKAAECNVDYLGVACLQEGVLLRRSGITIPILVLGAIHEDQIEDLIDYELEFTISSKYKADLVEERCMKLQKKCRVHVEIDTGMQRTGVRVSSAEGLFRHLDALPFLEVVGVYSHLATADVKDDPFAEQQIKVCNDFFESPFIKDRKLIRHVANSGGIVHFPASCHDMVRPGLLSFGYAPTEGIDALKEVAPFFSLKAKVAYFKVVAGGQGVSYGHTHITEKQTRIVTVPVGYGDGYRRSLSNRGSVLIRGKRFPIVGNICMDQFMVDVGDQEVFVGDEVILIGKQGNEEISLLEISRLCDTIPYEILCLFNDRIPRIYHG